MNYKKIYDNIIARRLVNTPSGYCEEHHIVPRSLGGTDEQSNLVRLTAREHFICHVLLTKIHAEGIEHKKMIYAFIMMFANSKGQHRYSPSREYANLRMAYAKMRSVEQTGDGNSQFGTMWIHHIEAKETKKIRKVDVIPDGWAVGRTPKRQKVERIRIESNQNLKREANVAKYTAWYELYSVVGFDGFVMQTGYKHSKENLVQQFSRYVVTFVPQNGKKRGNKEQSAPL